MKLRLLLPLLLVAATSFAQPAAQLDTQRKKFDALVDEIWEQRLASNPESASIQGDRRWNDRLTDRSAAAVEANAKKARAFLARVEAIPAKELDEQQAITRTILLQQFRNELEDLRLKNHEMPLTQFTGVYLAIPQSAPLMPFATEKDFTDWIARMHQVPRVFDDTIELMKRGVRDHLVPPKVLLDKAATQIEGLAKTPAEESPFAEPLKKLPASIDATRQAALRAELLNAIRTDVLPAYAKLAKFVREEYAPHGREDVGTWALPQGAERYASLVRRNTTTSMTPEEIHQLGLREVARDEAEMRAIAKKLGFDSIAALDASIDANPALHPKSREQILDNFRVAIAAMYEKLPLLFNRLPKQKVEVKATEAFREKTAATQYQRGTRDGSRPGYVVVVTYKPEERKTIANESTAYHEGVPGHHLQTAIAQELPGLPLLRQQGGYVAFGEGWALYAERLGKEVGLYTDPYSDYGRLQSDVFRAVRLVVDTGMHAKKWTRQQAVDYMHAHTNSADVMVQAEIDRYIAIPGQALGYKVGQLHILGLRAKAEKALGAKFDIREFHDEVLAAGSIPLDVLTQRIDAWIARKKQMAGVGTYDMRAPGGDAQCLSSLRVSTS
jgi:uncharacterized protein (DUF885 family)